MKIKVIVGIPFRFIFFLLTTVVMAIFEPHSTRTDMGWYWVKTGRDSREVSLKGGPNGRRLC